MRYFFLIMFVLTSLGCVAVDKSLRNYEACLADSVCRQQMEQVRTSTHVATETAVAASGIPTIPEAAAVVVSSLCAFAFGVLKGKKKGG